MSIGGSGGKMSYNSLQLVVLVVKALNLATAAMGCCLSGWQYSIAVRRRYCQEIQFERELIQEHLADIKLYKQHQ